jgi:hypothetical protein
MAKKDTYKDTATDTDDVEPTRKDGLGDGRYGDNWPHGDLSIGYAPSSGTDDAYSITSGGHTPPALPADKPQDQKGSWDKDWGEDIAVVKKPSGGWVE